MIVQGPDGKNIEFPDTMSPAQVNQAMQSVYGSQGMESGQQAATTAAATAPASSVLPAPARIPLGLASSALGGAENTIGLPGDIDRLGQEYLPSWMTKDLISGKPANPNETVFPQSQEILNTSNALGLTNNPHLAPQSTAERFGQAAAGGLGSALPMIATGGAALPMLASGLGGGLGGETAHEIMPDSQLAQIGGGLIGGMGFSGITEGIENALARSAAMNRLDEASANLAALNKAKPTVSVEGQQAYQSARQAAIDEFNQAKASAQDLHVKTIGQANTTLEGIASTLSPARTYQEAGQVMQDQARQWLTTDLPKKLGALWGPVNGMIDPGTEMELPEYAATLHKINTSAGALESSNQILKPGLPRQLEAALKGTLDNLQKGEGIPGEPGSAQPITWKDVQTLRSTLGDAMRDPMTVRSVGEQNLANLYRSITADMRTTAGQAGRPALDAFDQANQESTRLYQIAEGPMAKIVSGPKANLAEDPKPEAVAKAFISGGKIGATDLSAIRGEIPHAIDSLTATILRQPDNPWTKLAPETKDILAPGPSKSGIEMAYGNQAQAEKLLKTTLATAQAKRVQVQNEAKQDYQQNQLGFRDEMRGAKENYAAAQEAVKGFQKSKFNPNSAIIPFLSGDVGRELGIWGLNAMGLPGSDFVHGAYGAMAGFLAPRFISATGNALRNPGTLRGPLAAGVAGSNQLAPMPMQAQQ